VLLTSLTSVTGLSAYAHNHKRLHINFFHTVATLKFDIQQKPNCMQRFPFSSGQQIRKCSLWTGAPHFRHANLVLFGCDGPLIWQRFLADRGS